MAQAPGSRTRPLRVGGTAASPSASLAAPSLQLRMEIVTEMPVQPSRLLSRRQKNLNRSILIVSTDGFEGASVGDRTPQTAMSSTSSGMSMTPQSSASSYTSMSLIGSGAREPTPKHLDLGWAGLDRM
mmetsp:Transcript_70534/g.202053  ORF Transcript_70534/g.202053 Transcript_70534/m.202053 type:complete len:128 (-) Transcript_70534:50-433(-)